MDQNEPKQAAVKKENIEITVTNHTSVNIVILGRQVEEIDGWLKINVLIGEPGQHLKLVGGFNKWGDKVVEAKEITKPVA